MDKTKRIEKIKQIEKVMLDTAIKLARQGTGSLAVLELDHKVKYSNLFDNDVAPFNITESIRRYEILSAVDGAVIIDKEGKVKSYCAMIMNVKPYKNFGTRHSSAYTASKNGNVAVLSSEEDHKVRVFKDGRLIMQVDPDEKGIEKKTKEAVNILESLGFGFASYSAVAFTGAAVGLSLLPGVIVFGTSYAIIKFLFNYKNGKEKEI